MAVVEVGEGSSVSQVFADCLSLLHREGVVELVSEGRGMETAIAAALAIVRSFDQRTTIDGPEIYTEERVVEGKKKYVSKLKIRLLRKRSSSFPWVTAFGLLSS